MRGAASEQQHSHGALVGRDGFGNEYFENRRYQNSACAPSVSVARIDHCCVRAVAASSRPRRADQYRWVMYADRDNYKANSVPPDWFGALARRHASNADGLRCACFHAEPARRAYAATSPAWLHSIVDEPPSSARGAARFQHPVYEVPWTDGKAAEVRPISSYNPAVYMPKGYPKNPGGRKRWTLVQRWRPAGAPPLPEE
jgi:NADH:ubiquinone oxidoreductase subunit